MKKKILVAEDDADILFILDTILSEAGYNVEPLADGKSIVERKTGWPDLFILDKDIPYVDGLAICKFLKLQQETKDIPVVMISAFHYLKARAMQAGVDEFVEKPFELKNLLNVVEKHISHERRAT